MISHLNVKFQIFILLNFYLTNIIFITLNMFKITKDAVQNFINLKIKIINHQNNFINQSCDLIDV